MRTLLRIAIAVWSFNSAARAETHVVIIPSPPSLTGTMSRPHLSVVPIRGGERLRVYGTMVFPDPTAGTLDPARTGLEVRIEDLGNGAASVFSLVTPTEIPPATSTAVCDEGGDGWSVQADGMRQTYRNTSGAIDPPACTRGSARGLRGARFLRSRNGNVSFWFAAERETFGRLVGPLRVTIATPWRFDLLVRATHTFAYTQCGRTVSRGGFRCSESGRVRVVPTTTTTTTTLPPEPFNCASLLDATRQPGAWPTFPPSVATPGCAVDASNYVTLPGDVDPDAAEELHVLGVYRNVPPDGAEPGADERPDETVRVAVHASRKPVALFLSADHPVQWALALDPDAILARVFVQGAPPLRIDGAPPAVPVVRLTSLDTCPVTARGWEVRRNHGDYQVMIERVHALTGLREASFQACPDGDAFEVPFTGSPSPPAPPAAGDEHALRTRVLFAGCESIMAEDEYCLTASRGTLALLGLETGHLCPVVQPQTSLAGTSTTIAWRGEVLYACTRDGLIRISLLDGGTEVLQVPCDGVAANDEALTVLVPRWFAGGATRPLFVYRGLDDLLAGIPVRTLDVTARTIRLALDGDVLHYSNLNSADPVGRLDLRTGTIGEPLRLDGFDDRVHGMSITDAGHLIISSGGVQRFVRVFDALDGRPLRNLQPAESIGPLSCVSRGGRQ